MQWWWLLEVEHSVLDTPVCIPYVYCMVAYGETSQVVCGAIIVCIKCIGVGRCTATGPYGRGAGVVSKAEQVRLLHRVYYKFSRLPHYYYGILLAIVGIPHVH